MRIPPYFVATFAALLPVLALAQETSGTIAGVVRDPSQAVLAQARIAVTNEQTGLKRDVETNALGEYRVPFLPVGVYSVRAQKEGFNPVCSLVTAIRAWASTACEGSRTT